MSTQRWIAPLVPVAWSATVFVAGRSAGESTAAEQHVANVERAFAKTMADRDHTAFTALLADEAIFLAGTTVRRGKEAVALRWKDYFDDVEVPFSWEPETVAVLESGNLAMGTGPVYNTAGKRISTYTSVWRQENPGDWRIIFDKGERYCE